MHNTIHKHAADRQTGLTWAPVSGVQPVVYVARSDDRPVAILEMRPTAGFRLTTCTGVCLGDYGSLVEGEDALEAWLRRNTPPA